MQRQPRASAHQMREQATSLAQAIIEQAANRALNGSVRARKASSTARHWIPDVQRKREEVTPTVREIAMQAASAALELWQAARDRAEVAAEGAEHAIAESATELVSHAEQRAKVAAHHLAERADEVGERAKHATRDAASHMAERAEHTADRAKEATMGAAEATVETGKDTAATLFWAGAATGIIFYAILDDERRKQVLKFAQSMIEQARELIRDFQGRDNSFT